MVTDFRPKLTLTNSNQLLLWPQFLNGMRIDCSGLSRFLFHLEKEPLILKRIDRFIENLEPPNR